MVDNGLLKHYKSVHPSGGLLEASALGINCHAASSRKQLQKVEVEGKTYYVKSPSIEPVLDKQHSDAEILLSQVYARAGFKGAIYLPIKSPEGMFLISNNVESKNRVLGGDYVFDCIDGKGVESIPFLMHNAQMRVDPTSVFSSHLMQQQTKLRILDTASFVSDRHYFNLFYEFAPQQGVVQYPPVPEGSVMQYYRSMGMPNDVVLIDFESGAEVMSDMENGYNYLNGTSVYITDFDYDELPRERVIEQIAHSEELAQMVDKKQFAGVIGSLHPEEIAEDIYHTTGYEVDNRFVSVLSTSYLQMAETLEQ